MKRSWVASVLALFLAAPGCGEGTITHEDVLTGNIHSQQDPMIQTTLIAIDKGMSAGDSLMTQTVNQVLQNYGIAFFFQGTTALVDVATPGGPAGSVTLGGSCPFVGTGATTAPGTGPSSCSFLANQAGEQAQMAVDGLDPNDAVAGLAQSSGANPGDLGNWFMNGAHSSVDVTVVLLSPTLQKAGACNVKATAGDSALQAGIKLGRELYIQAINEKLKDVGIDFVYPNGDKPTTSIRYCEASLRNPALQDALGRVDSAIAQSPLCTGMNGTPMDQTGFAGQYQEVSQQYATGVTEGAKQEDTLAQNILKSKGACIASPLVLDLGGNGIALGGSAQFDLLSNGRKVISSWIQGDDAFLVRDVNGNGRIDDATELFGESDRYDNGFENLANYDQNGDGRIDSKEAVYSQLRLWQDHNGDGVSTSDELSTLSDMGVKAIELSYTQGTHVDSHGNIFKQTARFERTGSFAQALGTHGSVVDVWFAYR